MKKVTIYTDGACSKNPGPGGWSAVLIYGKSEREISGCEAHTTNNRMELTGAIEALRALKESCEVSLHTDSAYLCNAFARGWLDGWQRNGWKNAKKAEVENRDLWEALLALTSAHQVKFVKVKGHADDINNIRCDKLARAAVQTVIKSEHDA